MPTQGPQASQDSQDTQPAEPEERSEPAEELLPEVSLSNIEHQDIAGLSDTVQPKKRYRLSKKEISDYKFTQEQKEQIAEFVKEHPTLYDKRDKQWSNPRAKEELWRELAREFENCTFHQIRKYFEARRTDFGKIEKKENKSGAAARQRTTREEEVMSMWGFLGGHISHEPTIPSERFSPAPDGATPTMEIGGESSSGDMSGLSVTSIQRRKRLLKQRRTERGERRVGTPDSAEEAVHSQLSRIMDRMNQLIPEGQSKKQRTINVFVQYIKEHLEFVPEEYQQPFFNTVITTIHKLAGPKEENATEKAALARGMPINLPQNQTPKGTQTEPVTLAPQPIPTPSQQQQWISHHRLPQQMYYPYIPQQHHPQQQQGYTQPTPSFINGRSTPVNPCNSSTGLSPLVHTLTNMLEMPATPEGPPPTPGASLDTPKTTAS